MTITKNIIKLENEVNEITALVATKLFNKLKDFKGKVRTVNGAKTVAFKKAIESAGLDELELNPSTRIIVGAGDYTVNMSVDISGPASDSKAGHYYAKRVVYLAQYYNDDGSAKWVEELDLSATETNFDFEAMRTAFEAARRLEEQASDLRSKYCQITTEKHTYFGS